MGDWQSYRLQDFIPFTPEVYWRLLERVNEAFWPLHLLAVALGLAALLLAVRGRPRLAIGLLAPAWLSSGILFHLNYYAELNWAAPWFGWAFVCQAALLFVGATFGAATPSSEWPARLRLWTGGAVSITALLVYPAIAAVIGSGLAHAEMFGLHPDPTALATMGIALIALRGPSVWLALLVPSLWCLVTSLTLAALDAGWAWIPLSAALIIVAVALTTTFCDKRQSAA